MRIILEYPPQWYTKFVSRKEQKNSIIILVSPHPSALAKSITFPGYHSRRSQDQQEQELSGETGPCST